MGYKIRTALGAGTDKLRGAEFAESFSAPFLGPKGGPANPSPYLVTKTTYISSTPILGSTCFLFWTNKEFRPTDHGRSCVALTAYSLQRGPRTEISCFESAEVGLYSALVPWLHHGQMDWYTLRLEDVPNFGPLQQQICTRRFLRRRKTWVKNGKDVQSTCVKMAGEVGQLPPLAILGMSLLTASRLVRTSRSQFDLWLLPLRSSTSDATATWFWPLVSR